jgi:hypothetical protein
MQADSRSSPGTMRNVGPKSIAIVHRIQSMHKYGLPDVKLHIENDDEKLLIDPLCRQPFQPGGHAPAFFVHHLLAARPSQP